MRGTYWQTDNMEVALALGSRVIVNAMFRTVIINFEK